MSQGAAYGDDYQDATNYPLVRISVHTSLPPHIYYCRTHDHSFMGVQTGNLPVSTLFDCPGVPTGTEGDLVVVTNGIPSNPIPVKVQTTVTAAAHLTLTMTGFPNPVHEGSIVTYTMSFTNTGPADAVQGHILDYLPPGFTFVGSSVLPCGGGVGTVLCNLGPVVPAGFTLSFPIQVMVPPNFLQPGTTSSNAINTATIYSQTIDPHPGDNPVSVSTTVIP